MTANLKQRDLDRDQEYLDGLKKHRPNEYKKEMQRRGGTAAPAAHGKGETGKNSPIKIESDLKALPRELKLRQLHRKPPETGVELLHLLRHQLVARAAEKKNRREMPEATVQASSLKLPRRKRTSALKQ